MKTQNLIKNKAYVVKITELDIGSTVKIIEEDSYSDPELYFAVVKDMFNDGDKTFVELLIFKKKYSKIELKIKLYSGNKDVNFFPAKPDEVADYLNKGINKLVDDIKEDEEKLRQKKASLKTAKRMVNGQLSGKLKAVKYKTLSKEDQKKIETTEKSK